MVKKVCRERGKDMGLFGLLATIFTGATFLSETFKDGTFDSNSKDIARRNGSLTWMDSKGREYLVSTGERVSNRSDKIVSLKTGRVVYDYNQARIEMLVDRAEERGKKYIVTPIQGFGDRYYHIEIATMKRYYVMGVNNSDGSGLYHKYYFTDGEYGMTSNDEKIQITQEEFEELGGIVVRGKCTKCGL